MKNHADLAEELFLQGYSCSQSVFCAFCDVTGYDLDTAAKTASSFGGGMGRLREVCGAMSGALLVLGIAKGYTKPEDAEGKNAPYDLIQEFARRSQEQHGSYICRELLANTQTVPGPVPEPRTPAYYDHRPCVKYVRTAAEITDSLL